MITAKKARQLAGETVEEKVEKLSSAIEKLAKEHKRCLRTTLDYKDDEDLWILHGCEESEEWKKAKQILENHGYRVSVYFYKREHLFVMYTVIEW